MDYDDLESELRWIPIESELDDFQSKLAPDIPKLRIQRNTDVLNWESQNGVYCLFSEEERLLYVGYTLGGFGNRIRSHDQNKSFRWIDIIVLPREIEFLAPSLELFLRSRLVPLLDEGGNYV